MNFLIFENEIVEIENSFNVMNIIYYNNKIKFNYKVSSQDIEIEQFNDFDIIFIDIDLSVKSNKDGFGILEDIKNYNKDILNKVVIITGSNLMRKKLNKEGYETIPLLQKPFDFKDIYKIVQEKQSLSSLKDTTKHSSE